MFKIIKKNCCGLDVHKTWIFACIGITDSNDRTEYKQTRFSFFFKPTLVQVANGLLHSNKLPEITNRYRRIKARRGHKKAIIAVCRMLLTAIWHILTDLKPYASDGYLKPRPVNKAKTLTTSQALNLLWQRGYTIKDDPVTAT